MSDKEIIREKRLVRMNVPEFRIERSDGALPTISGYAAVFNSTTDLGYFTESIAFGAFTESIARGDDVRALFNHDPNLIIGRTKANTLTLIEDSKGLFCKITPPDTQLGRDLVVSIERGDVSQMSFGFYVDEEQADFKENSKPHYTIKKASLFDVSPVTFPAYEATEVEVQRHVRSRVEQINKRAKLEKEVRERKLSLLKN